MLLLVEFAQKNFRTPLRALNIWFKVPSTPLKRFVGGRGTGPFELNVP